jgi:hypothetical protein
LILNITSKGKFEYVLLKLLLLILYSITRDNASSNNTLISSFIRAYDLEAIKFQGDIACCAHVLNIATQEIISSIVKAEDSIEELDAIRAIEKEEEEDLEERNIFISQFIYLKIIKYKY